MTGRTDLPAGYRWATAEETERHSVRPIPGMIVVPRTADATGQPYTQGEADLALPWTVTHWLDGARNACGANLQQFGHSSREYVTCPKCRRVIDSQAAGQQGAD